MEVQNTEVKKIDAAFQVITNDGIKPVDKKSFKKTAQIIEAFVTPEDIAKGITEFYILSDEFNDMFSEVKFHNAGSIQFLNDKGEGLFRIHQIM